VSNQREINNEVVELMINSCHSFVLITLTESERGGLVPAVIANGEAANSYPKMAIILQEALQLITSDDVKSFEVTKETDSSNTPLGGGWR